MQGPLALVLVAATLGFLGGRRWPTPASGVEDRESGALRRGGSADVALPLARRLEEEREKGKGEGGGSEGTENFRRAGSEGDPAKRAGSDIEHDI